MKRRRQPIDEQGFLDELFKEPGIYAGLAASIVASEHRPRHKRAKSTPVVVVRKRRPGP
jgi:hypothetical protein